jgi:capsular exopolysaccharide synthesis family protein
MSQPAILREPAIVKRLLEHNMIEPNGKLTPQALVRCRVLTRWKEELKAKETAPQKSRPSIGDKLQTISEKQKPPKPPEDDGDKKLKIIHLAKEKTGDKTGDKISEKIEDQVEVKKEEEKVPEKGDNFVTALEARTNLPKPADVSSESRFTLGKAPAKYARREIEKDMVTLMNPQSFEAEQFKILRTNLLFPESGKTPRSVMVTSAVPGEGKSFVATNLAVSVARHVNWNVLLIDCDLRKPSVHKQFGFKNVCGLSDYLTNGTALAPLLQKTGVNNLSELLSSKRMAALLEEAATRYQDRLIILDSPPPKLTAETGALARYVDGILVVVKYGSTPKGSVIELLDTLGRNKIIGAVVNNFDAGFSRYHKKYYGGEYFRK